MSHFLVTDSLKYSVITGFLIIASIFNSVGWAQDSENHQKHKLEFQNQLNRVRTINTLNLLAPLLESLSLELQTENEKKCLESTLMRWTELSQPGVFATSEEVVEDIKKSLVNHKDCFDLVNSIFGKKGQNYPHGQFILQVFKSEWVSNYEKRKHLQIRAIGQFLIGQGGHYIPAAKTMLMILSLDPLTSVSQEALAILKNLDSHLSTQKILDFLGTSTLPVGSLGFKMLPAVSKFLNQSLRIRPALQASVVGAVGLHLGVAYNLNLGEKIEDSSLQRSKTVKKQTQLPSQQSESDLDLLVHLPFDFYPKEMLDKIIMRESLNKDTSLWFDPTSYFLNLEFNEIKSISVTDLMRASQVIRSFQNSIKSVLNDANLQNESDYGSLIQGIRSEFFKRKQLSRYKKRQAYLIPYVLGQGGNCQANTKVFISALASLQNDLPQDLLFGIQMLPYHVQPIVIQPRKARLTDLISGTYQKSLKNTYVFNYKYFIFGRYLKLSDENYDNQINSKNLNTKVPTPVFHIYQSLQLYSFLDSLYSDHLKMQPVTDAFDPLMKYSLVPSSKADDENFSQIPEESKHEFSGLREMLQAGGPLSSRRLQNDINSFGNLKLISAQEARALDCYPPDLLPVVEHRKTNLSPRLHFYRYPCQSNPNSYFIFAESNDLEWNKKFYSAPTKERQIELLRQKSIAERKESILFLESYLKFIKRESTDLLQWIENSKYSEYRGETSLNSTDKAQLLVGETFEKLNAYQIYEEAIDKLDQFYVDDNNSEESSVAYSKSLMIPEHLNVYSRIFDQIQKDPVGYLLLGVDSKISPVLRRFVRSSIRHFINKAIKIETKQRSGFLPASLNKKFLYTSLLIKEALENPRILGIEQISKFSSQKIPKVITSDSSKWMAKIAPSEPTVTIKPSPCEKGGKSDCPDVPKVTIIPPVKPPKTTDLRSFMILIDEVYGEGLNLSQRWSKDIELAYIEQITVSFKEQLKSPASIVNQIASNQDHLGFNYEDILRKFKSYYNNLPENEATSKSFSIDQYSDDGTGTRRKTKTITTTYRTSKRLERFNLCIEEIDMTSSPSAQEFLTAAYEMTTLSELESWKKKNYTKWQNTLEIFKKFELQFHQCLSKIN